MIMYVYIDKDIDVHSSMYSCVICMCLHFTF